MIERIHCQAEVHHDNCNGEAQGVDHFTARAIAKQLRWSHKQLNDPLNLIPMNRKCHELKDKVTPLVKLQVRHQLRGGNLSLGEHI